MRIHNVLEYFCGASRVCHGVTKEDFASDFVGDAFDQNHVLIQWMFPLPEMSMAQPQSPILTIEQVNALCASDEALDTLRDHAVTYRDWLVDNQAIWLTQYDHNHLRITRVIQCLSLFLGPEAAERFLRDVSRMNFAAKFPVNVKSVEFWKGAKWFGPVWRKSMEDLSYVQVGDEGANALRKVQDKYLGSYTGMFKAMRYDAPSRKFTFYADEIFEERFTGKNFHLRLSTLAAEALECNM